METAWTRRKCASIVLDFWIGKKKKDQLHFYLFQSVRSPLHLSVPAFLKPDQFESTLKHFKIWLKRVKSLEVTVWNFDMKNVWEP